LITKQKQHPKQKEEGKKEIPLAYSQHRVRITSNAASMPYMILKKSTYNKVVGNERTTASFSFHGEHMSPGVKNALNRELESWYQCAGAKPLQFVWDQPLGRYVAPVDPVFLENHEEDAIVCILNVLDGLGWRFCHGQQHHADSATSAIERKAMHLPLGGGKMHRLNDHDGAHHHHHHHVCMAREVYLLYKESVELAAGTGHALL
jgi:hypothetical protein